MMNNRFHPVSEPCAKALVHIQRDPLDLPEETRIHLLGCPPCREARVAWLAQEEAEPALAPAGYFDLLPSRVLAKLPPPARGFNPKPLYWAAAAAFFLAMGAGGFFLGLSQRPPMEEATLAVPSHEAYEVLPDTPFHGAEEALTPTPILRLEDLEPTPRRAGHPGE